jgi:hypothetical protein
VVDAHGRFDLPRESSGRMRQHSPRAPLMPEQNDCFQSRAFSENKTENKTALVRRREQDREQDGINSAPRTRRSDREPTWWLPQNAHYWL